MANESLNMYDDLSKLISNEEYFTGNSVLEILKKYSSMISVFDMMEFSSQVIRKTDMFRKAIERTAKNHT